MTDTLKATPGPWRWTTVDYDYDAEHSLANYREEKDGPFTALWSDGGNRPVFVAQDASSYAASCDFKRVEDAILIAAAPDLYEALIMVRDRIDRALAKAMGEQSPNWTQYRRE